MAPPLWPILMEIEVSRYASYVRYLVLTMHSDGLFKRYVIALIRLCDGIHSCCILNLTIEQLIQNAVAPPQPLVPPWR